MLSKREEKVLDKLLEGCSEEEIAARMGLTLQTIRTDLSRIQDKWIVSSNAGIFAEAVRNGRLQAPKLQSVSPEAEQLESETLLVLQSIERFMRPTNSKELRRILHQSTSYAKTYREMDEFLIRKVLTKNGKYMDLWLEASEKNKLSGWAFTAKVGGIYLIERISEDFPPLSFEYTDILNALAVFIKRELEHARTYTKKRRT